MVGNKACSYEPLWWRPGPNSQGRDTRKGVLAVDCGRWRCTMVVVVKEVHRFQYAHWRPGPRRLLENAVSVRTAELEFDVDVSTFQISTSNFQRSTFSVNLYRMLIFWSNNQSTSPCLHQISPQGLDVCHPQLPRHPHSCQPGVRSQFVRLGARNPTTVMFLNKTLFWMREPRARPAVLIVVASTRMAR